MSDPITPCPWCKGTYVEVVKVGTIDREGVPMAMRCECGAQAPWQYIPEHVSKQNSIVHAMLLKTWNERATK